MSADRFVRQFGRFIIMIVSLAATVTTKRDLLGNLDVLAILGTEDTTQTIRSTGAT